MMIDIASMTFQWPSMLWLLVLVPAFVAAYLWLLARGRKVAARYANLALGGQAAAGAGQKLRRHVPAVLLLLGLTALLFAVARPQAPLTLPARQETVILAMDVSGSMRATDLKPNRLAAAQEAAKAFVARQPRHVRIGVVAVAGAAAVVQSPTNNRDDIVQAIDRFQLQRGSAIGSGLLMALATLLPDAGIDVEQLTYSKSRPWMRDPARKPEDQKPVPPGSNTSMAIVLLSDGEANTGFDPLEAAKMAAERGVRIFTVGVGTKEGTTLGFDGWSMRVRLNEDMLKKIATTTEGEYFQAVNAPDLTAIYKQLTTRIALEKKRATEITAFFVALGAAFALGAALLSMFWYNRIL
jgi:Ca-activated chloride channel family protein